MTGRPLLAVAAALLLAACGAEQRGSGLTPRQVEALRLNAKARPEAEAPPPIATLGLEPLQAGDTRGANPRIECALAVSGQPVLAASRFHAYVRRDGEVQQLTVEGPIGDTGGFFRNAMLSVSIGRVRDPAAPDTIAPGPARVRVNDRRSGVASEMRAEWNCRG